MPYRERYREGPFPVEEERQDLPEEVGQRIQREAGTFEDLLQQEDRQEGEAAGTRDQEEEALDENPVLEGEEQTDQELVDYRVDMR